jgi:hypothetical protein
MSEMQVNTVVTYREVRSSVYGPEYTKINTVFKRNMDEKGVIIPSQFSSEEFEYLLNNEWTWTEKVDGTNIRLHFDGESITVGGRTDAAQVPGGMLYALAQYNNPPKWIEVFSDEGEQQVFDVTIYGEGYGGKIQSGGRYAASERFVVFDVRVGRWWLKREDVVNIANQLGMAVVPVIARCSLYEAIKLVESAGVDDPLYTEMRAVDRQAFTMEGLVGTPSVALFARNGARIIAKLKVKDFEALRKHEERRLATVDRPKIEAVVS